MTFRGVVRNNRVELADDAWLPDGASVDLRAVDRVASAEVAAPGAGQTSEAEKALLRDLVTAGLLEELPVGELDPDEPFQPVTVRGEPLSVQIIRERR